MQLLIRFAVPIIYLSAPVTLMSYGWGLNQIAQKAPLWVFLVVCASNVITALSFAALLDKRQQSPESSSRD